MALRTAAERNQWLRVISPRRSEVELEVDMEHRAPGANRVGISGIADGRSIDVHPFGVQANAALPHRVVVLAGAHFPVVAVLAEHLRCSEVELQRPGNGHARGLDL